MTREMRADYLDKLAPLEEQLDTGRVWLFSNSYSKAHTNLTTAIKNVKAYLLKLDDKEELTKEQEQGLLGLIQEVGKASGAYIKEKKEKDHYALESSDGVKKATGDKRTRLSAAAELKEISEGFAENYKQEMQRQGKEALRPGEVDSAKIGQVVALIDKDSKLYQRRERGMKALKAASEYKNEKNEYANSNSKVNGKWSDAFIKNEGKLVHDELKENFKLIMNLHRDEILKFEGDTNSKREEEFVQKFRDHRLNIAKAVDAYETLKEFKNSKNPEKNKIFDDVTKSLGLTESRFQDVEIKAKELKYMGTFFDNGMNMLRNPAGFNMSPERRKSLTKRSVNELVQESQRVTDPNESEYIKSMAIMKKLAKFGIKQYTEGSVRKEADMYSKEAKKGSWSGKMKFFGGYVKGTKPKLFSPETQEATYDLSDPEGATEKAVNIGTNVATGKFRMMKLGGNYQSKGGLVKGTARLNVGRVKTGANVGLTLSASDILQSKIQASAEAEAVAAHGTLKGKIGGKDVSVNARVDGKALMAKAGASVGAGLMRYEDSDGETHDVLGAAAQVEAMASLVKGEAKGGFSVFGVRFGAGVEGYVAGVGAKAGVKIFGSSVSVSLGAALGLGMGLNLSVDWSGLKSRISNWRARRKQRNEIRKYETEAAAKNAGKDAAKDKTKNSVRNGGSKRSSNSANNKKKSGRTLV